MAKLKADGEEQIPVEEVPAAPEDSEVLDNRWFVEEYFPARVENGITINESWNRNYSEVFATEKEANSWIAKHQPDYEGGKFRKAHEVQRAVTVVQWMPA